MILRPVSPVSAAGPPLVKGPAGLTWSCEAGAPLETREAGVDHEALDRASDLGEGHGSLVLGRDDDRGDARRTVGPVLDRDLGLAVGAQPRQLARVP